MSGVGTPKKKRRWIWWVVLAVLVAATAAIVVPMMSPADTSSSYTTAEVEKRDLDVTVSGSGNGVVSDVTEVQPGITGTVKDLSVKLGDTVETGDLLFRIVNDDLDAAVQRAKSSLTQAKQQLSSAKANVMQAENTLYKAQHPSSIGTAPATVDSGAVKVAKQQLASAKLGRTAAEQGLTSANTALSQAEDNADKRTVRAPVSGVITVLNAQNGQSLSGSSSSSSASAASATGTSNSAVEISNLSTLRARVAINEVDLVKVKVGMTAAVTFDSLPDLVASGTISAIAPTGSSSSGGAVTYNVDITLDASDARLRPTMSCTAEIITATRPAALSVPSSAVRTNATTKKKYVLVGDTTSGAITTVDVTTGVVVGTRTEILTGLTAGQTVLIGGDSASGTTGTQGGRGGMGGMGAFMGRG